jgi:hypothetical protein
MNSSTKATWKKGARAAMAAAAQAEHEHKGELQEVGRGPGDALLWINKPIHPKFDFKKR